MRAALRIVERAGMPGLTMRAIASRTGTSHVALYRHFASKEELVAAIAETGFRILRQQLVEVIAKPADPLDQFHRIGLSYIDFAMHYPAYFRIMYARELSQRRTHARLQAAAADALALTLQVIQRGQATGSIVAANPVELALSGWALTHGLAVLISDRQFEDAGVSGQRVVATAMARFHEGLRPPARRRRSR